jgi:hypothetical protein
LSLITLSSLFAFAACSDDDDDGTGPNVAGQTSEAGAPSQGVGGKGGSTMHSQGGSHEGGALHSEASLECQVLGELCHAADTGGGPADDCHQLGHVGNAEACTARFASCIGTCTGADVGAGGAGSGDDPKCAALGALCHAAGEIDADAEECHDLGHEGNAAACAEGFDACAILCLAVLEHVDEGAGGAGGAAHAAASSGGAGGAQ